MLLLIEIGLAIFASRRGWKGWAAIPLLSGLLLGLAIGIGGGMSGMDQTLVVMTALSIDGIAILSLAVMCAVRGPYGKNEGKSKSAMPGLMKSESRSQSVDGYKLLSQQAK